MKQKLNKYILRISVMAAYAVLVTFANAQDEFVNIPDTIIRTTDAETDIPVKIMVSNFIIGKTEVTQDQFQRIMGFNPSFYKADNKPVEGVSWWDAIQYCNKRSIQEGYEPCYDLPTGYCDFNKNGYRLPTNTEWSVANSCSDNSPNVDTQNKKGNLGRNNTEDIQLLVDEMNEGTAPVAQYEPNKFGIFDMIGNVWEWCYDYADFNNPAGNSRGIERIIRGGSFVSPGRSSWNRTVSSMAPEYSSRYAGFRIARSPEPRSVNRDIYGDPEWFAQFDRAPEGYRNNLGQVPSLLETKNGDSIKTVNEWIKKKEDIIKKWAEIIGKPSLDNIPEVNVKLIKTYDEDIYWGKLMYLQVEPGFWEKIYLMIPKNPIREPVPVVISPYYDVDVPAGKNMGGRRYGSKDVRHFSHLAVQHGYVSIAVRWFGESYGESYAEAVANLHTLHPECSGMGKWVWDIHRKENIGFFNHATGHAPTPEAVNLAFEWFNHFLNNKNK